MIIACDFDDTIENRQNIQTGYRMGSPEPGAVASLRRLVNEGHTIIVFTARNVQDKRSYKAVADWLDYFQIPYNGITNIKSPQFDVIIDNIAIHYDSWPQVLMRLTALQNQTKI